MKRMYRVTKTQEFQQIIQKKQFVANKSFSLYVKPKKEEQARFGISAGKKIGNAVTRNKIKRQIRMMLQELDVFGGDFDGIVIVRKDYLLHTYEENKKDLASLLKKVKM